MKVRRILLSVLMGCFLTGLVYLYGTHPRNGPSLGIMVLIIPFQIVASLIAESEPYADIAYFTIQVVFWGLLCFTILCFFGLLKKGKNDR